MEGPRWKYAKAKDYAAENPVSDVYKQMQSSPLTRSFLSQTAVVVQADEDEASLLNKACFGRPILVGPQAALSFSEPSDELGQENAPGNMHKEMLLYELGFEEAFFLNYELKCLQVSSRSKQEDVVLKDEDLWRALCSHKPAFLYLYVAYSHLRRKNWIVRPGLQYGADWIAYRHHPSQVHAEYSVIVVPEWEKRTQLSCWSHMQGIIRLCGNVAKTLLLLNLTRGNEDDLHHPGCLENFTVQEMEVKRWLPQKHRMDKSIASTCSPIEKDHHHGG